MPKRVWILTGDEINWDRAIADEIWGVREGRLKKFWDRLENGDLLIFYVKAPISAAVGVGLAENKFRQDKPLWLDEVRTKTVIYPYRFEFKIIYYLPKERWKADSIALRDLKLGIQAGMNPVSNPENIGQLIGRINQKWRLNLSQEKFDFIERVISIPKEAQGESLHNNIRDILREVGVLEGFLSEIEYPLDGQRLDVAWRKVVNGVPTRVFEVQIGGNVTEALSKLKHANDLWNSEPFIVITDKDREKVNSLLSGTFHEIANRIRILTVADVEELYRQALAHIELKKRMGI